MSDPTPSTTWRSLEALDTDHSAEFERYYVHTEACGEEKASSRLIAPFMPWGATT
jgi:hypothetical protein